jgi:hypothetical protein
MALPSARSAGDPLYVALRQRAPASELDLRLRPVGATGQGVELGRAAARTQDLLKVALAPDVAPGLYEVQARDPASGAELGTSEPLRIGARGKAQDSP